MERFENAALLLPLGFMFTLIPYETGAFRRRSSTRKRKRWLFVFVWRTANTLKTELSENDSVTMICDSVPCRVFLKHKSKMAGYCYVFKFFRQGVDGKHLMRFQFQVLWITKEGASLSIDKRL